MLNYGIYKQSAAFRLNLVEPKSKMEGEFPNPGGYFIDIAKSTPASNTKYDWTSCAKFFVSFKEVTKLIAMLKGDTSISLIHDPKLGGKTGDIKSLYTGVSGDTTFLNFSAGTHKIGIAMDKFEVETVILLLQNTIHIALGWK